MFEEVYQHIHCQTIDSHSGLSLWHKLLSGLYEWQEYRTKPAHQPKYKIFRQKN